MYLKSIEIYGFKSFADRTLIEFNDSLTCLVGPNGSGKSNITDAIQWVLGEQSYLTLRGAKMGDIIFKGTNHRRPLGMAEVIATFDNSDMTLDIPYTTIEIKRKLYKNGDSQYFINGSQCRLKDIRELFMDTGIGRDGYSIIGQGRIADILNSKPEERIRIFEEAAGISRYKFERSEIEKKLNTTTENMIRVADIIKEIEKQERTLRKQSESGKKYLELYQKTKDLELKKSSIDYNNLQSDILKLIETLDRSVSKKDQLDIEIEALEEEYNNIQEKLSRADSKINEYQLLNVDNIKREQMKTSEKNLLEERIINSEESVKELTYRNKSINAEYKNSLNYITNLKTDINTTEKNLKELNSQSEKNAEQKTIIQSNLKKILEEKNTIESKLDKVLLDISKHETRLDSLIELESNSNTIIELDKQIRSIQEDKKKLKQNYKDLSVEKDETDHCISNKNKELDGLKNQIKDENLKLEKIDKNYIEKNRKLQSNEARLESLEQLESSYDGYNRSIKSFFNFYEGNNLDIKGLNDTVANIMEVKPKYEKAITVALGGAIQNLVVNDFKDAQEIIKLLRDNNLGRITFLPIDSLKTYKRKINSGPGLLGRGDELISYQSKYDVVFSYLLGGTLIVDNLVNAKKLSSNNRSMKIATLSGDIIYPGGSVSGGQSNFRGNIFSRKNELNNLKETNKKLNFELKNLKTKYKSVLENKRKVEDKIQVISEKLLLDLDKQDNINKTLYKLEYELNKTIDFLGELSTKKQKTKLQMDNIGENKRSLNKTLRDLAYNKKDIKEKLVLLTEKENKLEEQKNNIDSIISEASLKNVKITSKLEYLNQDLNTRKRENKKYLASIDSINDSIESIKNQIDENIKQKDHLNDEISKIKETISKNKIDYTDILELRKKLKKREKELNGILSKYRVESLNLDKNIFELNSINKQNKQKLESIIRTIRDKYYFSFIESLEPKIESFTEKEEKRLKNLLKEIRKLGNVNLNAIEEHAEVESRLVFNKEQFEDLDKAKEQLNDLLDNIEIVMIEKFNESFEEINSNFEEIFKYMFGGGSAELILTGSKDLDEMGVDIQAQLPGKRIQPLNALSGGEKSMTAVSLVFSFLKTNPAPFCLLDEVDAALDESNIGRFVSYLKTLSDIQFALITHRKPTMESADSIYGITMEEPGVSKVISLQFDEDYERINNV